MTWTRTDRTIGAATLLLLISLFLPWYTLSGYGVVDNGIQGHGWMWSSFIVCVAVIALLAARRGSEQLRSAVPSGAWPLMGLTGLNLLLVLAAFAGKPYSGIYVSWQPVDTTVLTALSNGSEVPFTLGLGAFVGLACALVAAGTAGLAVARRSGSREDRGSVSRPEPGNRST